MTWRSEVSFDPLGDEHIPLMGGFRLWLHAGPCAPSHSENHLAPPVSESHKRLKKMMARLLGRHWLARLLGRHWLARLLGRPWLALLPLRLLAPHSPLSQMP